MNPVHNQPPNQDYRAFARTVGAEAYHTIGDYNLFMMCRAPNPAAFGSLPEGYHRRLCRPDELAVWMRTAVDAAYIGYLADYYQRLYAPREDAFFRQCTFVCNSRDEPVATGFIWRAYGAIDTLAWLRTLPAYEGRGIGRALIGSLLQGAQYPVYLHTQPTSARAIKLYSDFGFALITDPVVGFRENHLQQSLPYLRRVLPRADYQALRTTTADAALLKAACSSEFAEF